MTFQPGGPLVITHSKAGKTSLVLSLLGVAQNINDNYCLSISSAFSSVNYNSVNFVCNLDSQDPSSVNFKRFCSGAKGLRKRK